MMHENIVRIATRSLKLAGALIGVAGLLLLGQGKALAQAQAYPKSPIKLVMPWPAGGMTDLATRMLAKALSARLSTPVVVDNRPGASGQIGANFVANATADGYTLLLLTATHSINANVYRKLPFDSVRDFVGIAPFAINPFSLAARADFPANSVKEMVAAAKQNPGKYTHASWGLGSTAHLVMEMMKAAAGIDMLHVPYPGETPAVTALLAGQVDVIMLPAGSAARHAGKLKVFAVTVPERFFILPNTPTLKEEGYPNIDMAVWFGLVAPAKTPNAIVQRLAAEIAALTQTAELQSQYRGLGLDVHPPMSQPEFHKFIATDVARWGEVIRRANVPLLE